MADSRWSSTYQRRAKVTEETVKIFTDPTKQIDPTLRYGPGCTGEAPKKDAKAVA